MASRSLPIPFRQAKKRSLTHTTVHAPSLRTAIIAFIAVLILFRWLHLILALQITSTSRQIRISTEELGKVERQNALLQENVAAAESPRRLAEEAHRLGYGPRLPVYIPVDTPIGHPAINVEPMGEDLPQGSIAPSISTPIWDGSASAFSTWLETKP